jgi:hypothetical protein
MAKTIQVPSETKPALWSAAAGPVALAIVGFTWGGWMTTGTANKLADERADPAVVAVLTPDLCREIPAERRCDSEPRSVGKTPSSWEEGNFIEKDGWATHPEATSADYVLARTPAEKLVQVKSAAQ